MKRLREISARKVAIGLLCWFVIANCLVGLSYFTNWWPCKIALFVCVSFLPGAAALRSMRITPRNCTIGVLYSFGLSVLALMLSGLAANQILYTFGIARPLELPGILGAWDVVTASLIVLCVCTNSRAMHIKNRSAERSKVAWMLVCGSILLPLGAMMGAFRLNNGGNALFAELTLGYAAILIACAFLLRRHLSDGVLAWLVFAVGLTILLMTSLRGWDIVGHDIEREFRVYTLTHLNGRWNIGLDRSPYNACLSITILPEMFAKLLNISGLVVFKVVLQIAFAACPAVVYVLLRQYVSKLGSLVGCVLFIAYPTFIDDSAMLTRQGVAYLFFALALLVMSNKARRKRYKLLFLLCALGAVLSHYSTAYMFVALFAVATICKLALLWWQKWRGQPVHLHTHGSLLSPLFAGLLFLMTFVWYTQITATSGGLSSTIRTSFVSIPKLFSGDSTAKSSDVSRALVFGGHQTEADLYQSYLASSHGESALAEVNAAQYLPALVSDSMPLTPLGKDMHAIGFDASLITTLRQNFAKILQLLALAGVLYATYRWLWKKPDALSLDFICLNLAGLALLACMVALPVLSINYGILRAFQQALIFLLLPMVLLLARLGQYLWNWLSAGLTVVGMVFLFLLFTGFFAQMLGGTSPTLSMDNSGIYFGLYYSSKADSQAFVWLKAHVTKESDVRAANFNRALMHDPNYPFSTAGILPPQISARSYVYLDPTQVQTQRLYAYYKSSPLTMTFPLNYYEQTKNEIYSTTSTRIYQ